MATKTTRVGGPLLGRRAPYVKKQKKHDPLSWLVQEPLLFSKKDEQFVVLPNTNFLTILAYATGKQVASLVPQREGEKGQVSVESVILTKYPRKSRSIEDVLAGDDDDKDEAEDDQVLLVGCNDGTLREFSVADIMSGDNSGSSAGSFGLLGRTCGPRRVISIKRDKFPIKHLTAPMAVTGGVLLYSLIDVHTGDDCVKQDFCRLVLPPFDGVAKQIDLTKEVEKIEKVTCRLERSQLRGDFENTVPFRLLSLARKVKKGFAADDDQDRDVFCVIARLNEFKVYHERIQVNDAGGMNSTKSPVMQFNPPAPMSAMTISPDGMDIACGHWAGEMRILSNAFPTILDYLQKLSAVGEKGRPPPHPSTTILVRTVHWHAHPVTSLSYHEAEGVDPLLYSGGEESVLAIWQLSRGTRRPADTLPRLAKAGIAHILSAAQASTPGILVFCGDNTLQLVQAHNLKTIWKLQGLGRCTDETTLRRENQSIIMSGLHGAPGFLQWFSPRSQSVEDELEVAPYNRVSRTEADQSPMPQPKITNIAFSADLNEIVTVETIPTENTAIGKMQKLRHGGKISNVSSVKFWARSPKKTKEPYVTTASMTYPHGEKNKIAAVAMSRDGQYACTVSNDEKAFRVWHQTSEQDEDDKGRRRPVWTCLYRITTPSGFSNHDTPLHGVSFSPDGSTLCIVYGYMISLWDHKQATLLNSLRHVDEQPIEHMEFVNTDFIHDSILTRSKTGVKLQSPYGSQKSMNGWSCGVPDDGKAIVTQAHAINGEQVAIAISFPADRKTKILYVKTTTGEPVGRKSTVVVPFKIQSMILAGPRFKRRSGFVKVGDDPVTIDEPPIRFFAMSVTGELFLVQSASDTYSLESVRRPKPTVKQNSVPKIHMPPSRKRSVGNDDDNEDEPAVKRAAVGAFLGEEDSTPLASAELPFLSGNFVRAFVGRNQRRRGDDDE